MTGESYYVDAGSDGWPPGNDVVVPAGEVSIVHLCPPMYHYTMPCCGLSPFEVPRWHRITVDAELVTCTGLPVHWYTMTRTPGKDGWVTISVKLRASDAARLDTVRAGISRSEWIRLLVTGDLGTRLSRPEVIAPGAFKGKLPADVPLSVSSGERIGTAHVTEDARGLSVSMKIDCTHPKARRSKGGLCMACGQNVGE